MKRFKEYRTTELHEFSSGMMVSDPGDIGAAAIEYAYYPGKSISSFAVSPADGKSPIDRYFDNNQADADNTSNNTFSMLKSTPGQGDGEEDAPIQGMNTNALNMGPAAAAEEEKLEKIRQEAIAKLKHAQERWQFLKTWIKDFDVDSKAQAKIAGLAAVAGINAPSIAKMAKTYILPSGKRAEI